MEPRYKKLSFNTALLLISTFAGKFLVFLLMPLYTGRLTPEQYSSVDLIIHTVSLMLPFVTLGIVNSLLRFGLDENYKQEEVFSSSALIYCLGIILTAGIIPIGAKLLPFFKTYGLSLFLYLFANCLHTLMQQSVRAKEKITLYAIDGLLNTLLTLSFTCLFLLPMRMKVDGYILAIVLSDVICSIVLMVAAKLYKDYKLSYVNKQLLSEMLRYCTPLIPASLCWWIVSAADRYFVVAMTSAAIGGLYAISHKLPSIVSLLSTVFSEAWQISAIKEIDASDSDNFYTNVYRTYSSIVFMASSGLILICKPLLTFMVAQEYREAWVFIPLLVMGSAFSCLSSFVSSIYVALKDSRANVITVAIGAACSVIFNLTLISAFGTIGASLAVFLSHLAIFSSRMVGLRRNTAMNLPAGKVFISSILMLVLCYFTIEQNIALSLLTFVVTMLVNAGDLLKALKVQGREVLNRLK